MYFDKEEKRPVGMKNKKAWLIVAALLVAGSMLTLFSCDVVLAEDYLYRPNYTYGRNITPVFERWHNEAHQEEINNQRAYDREMEGQDRTMEMLNREREESERDNRHMELLTEQRRQADALERMADEMERR